MAKQQSSRESRASSCSQWTLSWFTNVITEGGNKVLEQEDLGGLSVGDDSLTSYNKLQTFWTQEVKDKGLEAASLMNVWWKMIDPLQC